MEAPVQVRALVDRFREHRDALIGGTYNETQLRREFVDPFFKALGWDVANEGGYAEAYKDVIHEDSIKVGGATKAPDYCFRIGGTRKFFVETKKPSVKVKEVAAYAYQVRRYGWSAQLPVCILTDFDEFAVYDCRQEPKPSQKASTARVLYMQFGDYVERWDELYNVFSRDAVLRGAFDKFVEEAKGKRGTSPVDKAFLAEIEEWREALARNIALRNPAIGARGLNYAVQQTIDRLIFLRICEDRGIEPYGQLQGLLGEKDIYPRLFRLFRRADDRYNSGLFHFEQEKKRESPDTLTPKLDVDDGPLRHVLKRLYYPDSPYEFSVLPADILGQVYEQFLGKVIRLTSGHRAVVDKKPEVRKAGGVFYTPTYVVDIIVKETLGRWLEGKTPQQASKLRIVDPACGSGSFLIGAYQYLLDWHRDYYSGHDPEEMAKGKDPALHQASGGEWHLTTSEKKRILLNNIYGVDIDTQAVEVTKLSLLLKVLEGESAQSLAQQLKLFQERALPDLDENIRCGNSLISSDFYKTGQLLLLDSDRAERINAFDWTDEFPTVFKAGGFDVVIGNPPYIQLSMAAYYEKDINQYVAEHYSGSMGRLNTFGFFIERSLQTLARPGGYVSFIVPNTVLTQEFYEGLREQMLQNEIINLTSFVYPVFEGAIVETVVFALKLGKPTKAHSVEIAELNNRAMRRRSWNVAQKRYSSTYRHSFVVTADEEGLCLQSKLDKAGPRLGSLANLNQAIALKHDRSASIFPSADAPNYKRVLDGRDISRYGINWSGDFLAYDVSKIHSCKRTDIFEADEKLLFRRVGARLIATYDDEQFYALNTLVVITPKETFDHSLKYLLALLNSTLLNFYYVKYLKSTKRIFSEIQARQLAELPIRLPDPDTESDQETYESLIELSNRMLDQKRSLFGAETPNEVQRLNRRISKTDVEIDDLIFALYGLDAASAEKVRNDAAMAAVLRADQEAPSPVVADETPHPWSRPQTGLDDI